MHPDEDVYKVDKVKGVVDDIPAYGEVIFQLPENGSAHHEQEIVQDGAINDTQPTVVRVLTRVKDQITFEKGHVQFIQKAKGHTSSTDQFY